MHLLATATTLAGWGVTFGITLVVRERVQALSNAQPSLGPAFWLPAASSACMALATIFQAWASGWYERRVMLAHQRAKAWAPHFVRVDGSLKESTPHDVISPTSRYEVSDPRARNRSRGTNKSDSDQSPNTPVQTPSNDSSPSHS